MERTSLTVLGLLLALGMSACASEERDQALDQDRLQDCEQGSDCDPDQIRDQDRDDDPDQDRDRDQDRDDSDSGAGDGSGGSGSKN